MSLTRSILQTYRHEQTVAASTWTIAHNLYTYPVVDAWTTDGGSLKKIMPQSVTYTDANTVTLTFTSPISGYAMVS